VAAIATSTFYARLYQMLQQNIIFYILNLKLNYIHLYIYHIQNHKTRIKSIKHLYFILYTSFRIYCMLFLYAQIFIA